MTAPTLISTDKLALRLDAVKVVDASWYMPGDKRDPRGEFEAGHIPGAVFYDLDGQSDHSTDLPHMFPSPQRFAEGLMALGLGSGDTIVVYDGAGLFSAARLWWMLRAMGHDQVMVLDGGLPKWTRENRPLETGPGKTSAASMTARPVKGAIRNFGDVAAALGTTQILDARSPSRFTGEEKEPRAGVRSGHMPGAVNIHFRSLINADGTLKDDAALKTIFADKGVDLAAPIITSCGSGVTAAILMLALARLGAEKTSLYDGSWSEWGGHPDARIETGPA